MSHSIAELIDQGDEIHRRGDHEVAEWLCVNWPRIRTCMESHTITMPAPFTTPLLENAK